MRPKRALFAWETERFGKRPNRPDQSGKSSGRLIDPYMKISGFGKTWKRTDFFQNTRTRGLALDHASKAVRDGLDLLLPGFAQKLKRNMHRFDTDPSNRKRKISKAILHLDQRSPKIFGYFESKKSPPNHQIMP